MDIRLGKSVIKIGNSYYVTVPKQLIKSEIINPNSEIDVYARVSEVQ